MSGAPKDDLAKSLAHRIQGRNALNLPTRLILPAWPEALAALAALSNNRHVSWTNVHVFLQEEWLDWQGRLIAEEDPLSKRAAIRRELVSKLNDPPPLDQFHFPHPANPDSIAHRIQQAGGIDFCYAILPIAAPLAPVPLETLRTSSTRVGQASPGSPYPLVITLGMAEILAARQVRVYGHSLPAGLFDGHPDAEIAAIAIT